MGGDKAVQPLIGRLLEEGSDERPKARSEVAICSPVGDERQLRDFHAHVKALGLDRKAQFIFVYRQGIKPLPGLPAIHFTEKYQLGTSGAFFACQALAYRLGYPYAVVTDLDAFLDSEATFDRLLGDAKKTGKCTLPLTGAPDNMTKTESYSMNHWTVFPRRIFEDVGFSVPYFARGGDDYEVVRRYQHAKALCLFREGRAAHPASGYSIYHQMAEPKKFYPYIASHIKSLLIAARYEARALMLYFLWRLHFSFFADVFSDAELLRAIANGTKAGLAGVYAPKPQDNAKFSMAKVREKGDYHGSKPSTVASIFLSPLLLLVSGRYLVHTEEVVLGMGRIPLALGIVKACALVPLRMVQALAGVTEWAEESKKLQLDMRAANLDEIERVYERLLTEKIS